MHKILSGAGVLLLAFLLLVFTSAHTVNFIIVSIPGDNQLMAYMGLAAFDIGLIGWLYAALFNAISEPMRAVSWVMVFVNMLGVFALFAADTFLVAGRKGATARLSQDTTDMVLWAMVIVVCLNILATVLYHAFDPHAKLRSEQAKAQARLRQQELEIEIRMKEAELRHRGASAELIGEETARVKASAWVDAERRRAREGLPQLPDSQRVVNATSVTEIPPKVEDKKPAPLPTRQPVSMPVKKKVAAQPISKPRGYGSNLPSWKPDPDEANKSDMYQRQPSHQEQLGNFFGKLRQRK